MKSQYAAKNEKPVSRQCAAKTVKGEQCKRPASFKVGKSWYCMMHLTMARRTAEGRA
jgi:hypothetical protein